MPTFQITSPDGKKYKITAPEGATKEQVLAYAQAKFRQPATEEQLEMVDAPSRIGRGMMDPISGLAQLAHNAVPESIRGPINRADQWLYEKTGGVLGNPEQDLNLGLRAQEQKYQEARQAAGQTGLDAYRLAGNLASTVPLAMAAPTAGGLLARTGTGALTGGMLGATNPVYNEDYWGTKGDQVGLGAALGGALTPVGAALGRVVSPVKDKVSTYLNTQGIRTTPGQTLGGVFKTAEEKLTSMPITGDFIRASQKRGLDDFNRAAYNRALAPIGKSADDFPVGREGVAMVKNAISDAYEKLLPKLSFKADSKFNADLSQLRSMAGSLEPKFAGMFEKLLKDKVFSQMTPQRNMSGESLKRVQSELRRISSNYAKGADAGGRDYAAAVKQLDDLIRQGAARNSPAYAAELKAIDKGFANYARIRRAGSMQGAEDGFTPAQLSSASKALDASVGKGQTATGQALMQDLTDAARKGIANKYPDSGTAGRLLFDAGALTTGLYNPAIPLGLFAGGLPYTQLGQRAMNAVLTKRPPGAEQVAGLLRYGLPAAGAAGGPGLLHVR